MNRTIFQHFSLTLLGFLFILSFSVVLILNFRPLYYHDMKSMNLSGVYGVSEEEITANYDTLITYNSLFYQDELSFPTLPMSDSGKIHFEEVKLIFDALQILLIASTVLFWPLALYTILKKKEYCFLKWIPVFTGILISVILVWALIDWEGLFVTFHHLMFRNDYWLFDPYTDPIILFLPDIFFFHCLAGIIGCILILLTACLISHRILKKRSGKVSESVV